jgi:soluble lytic murein transglycosylase-like protein
MHPTAHKASFEELSAWLSRYADLAGADRVFALALKRRPPEAALPRTPILATLGWGKVEDAARRLVGAPVRASDKAGDKSRKAREAFYSGDAKLALSLAPAAGETWIAGLAAYRLKDYGRALGFFEQVANNSQDPWMRSAGGFWAARSADALGERAKAAELLGLAAREPDTFYGMIAERQTRLAAASGPTRLGQASAPTGDFVLASYEGPTVELSRFIKTDPRAHRAAGLAQIGLANDAGLELRAGLTLAKTQAERDLWTALIMSLNGPLTSAADAANTALLRLSGDYPTPLLEPQSGFTIDKSLVYAIVRQESRFNPLVVSQAGAIGLMQLMPDSAAHAAGDDKLKTDATPLFDPSFNLRVGQDYVTWLMERGVGHDLLRTVAAYNGGPGTLTKTAQMLGDDADSLLLIECLPAQETRNYVEKVVAAYWTYRRMFGEETRTLDALALGARTVDSRLDR